MCSIRAFQLGRCHLCAPGTGASREPHGGGRPPLWPPVAPGCEGGFGGPGSTPFPEHDADKDQRHVPGSPCQPHSRLESEADVVEGRARPAAAVSLRPACLPRWVWDGPGGPALCGVSSPSRVGRLNHSCTQGADVSEMPAFQWGGGGGGAGLGDRPVLLGGHSPRPLPGLGTAQPDTGAKRPGRRWPARLLMLAPPHRPQVGSERRDSGDSTPFPGCRDLSAARLLTGTQRGPWPWWSRFGLSLS